MSDLIAFTKNPNKRCIWLEYHPSASGGSPNSYPSTEPTLRFGSIYVVSESGPDLYQGLSSSTARVLNKSALPI